MKQARWALFISGQGSNMSALLDLASESVALVVSSSPRAYGLSRARRSGVETLVLDPKADWMKLHQTLEEKKITHIFLLGFMKIVPRDFLKRWSKPILNVHPSLLPSYPGLKSIERAMADKADIGVTVHKVIADVDAGETVARKKILSFDEYKDLALEDIEKRVHEVEYDLVRRAHKVASCWT